MSMMMSPRKPRGGNLTPWRPKLPTLRGNRRLPRSLAAAGAVTTLAVAGVATAVVLGSLAVAGVGALILGALAVGGYWFQAKHKGIWLHVLVDTDDVVISLALPIPISLLRRGVALSPASDGAVEMARLILEDPELMSTLHHDAIEIMLDSGNDHIEVVIGPRRKKWRAIQFNPVRSFSQTKSLINQEETNYV